jgi:hypothetical protein
MVGYKPSDARFMCTSATVVSHLTVPYHVASIEQGAAVTLCALKKPLPQEWARLKNFS